jgi:hypothetical protein
MLLRGACLLVALLAAGCVVDESRVREEKLPAKCQALGPWSTWPEADWVRSIVSAGGYNVFTETGSALVASGKGHEFYIWATEARGRLPRQPNWRRLATVRGVPVYGDRNLWRGWHAQGFNFWVQGSGAPAAGRLAPVVDASLRLPFVDECDASRPKG